MNRNILSEVPFRPEGRTYEHLNSRNKFWNDIFWEVTRALDGNMVPKLRDEVPSDRYMYLLVVKYNYDVHIQVPAKANNFRYHNLQVEYRQHGEYEFHETQLKWTPWLLLWF